MTIIEGNKLIGIFDGWYQKDLPKNGDLNWFHDKYSTKITDSASIPTNPENFKYHSSWDWLMPVVQKIGEIDSEWLADNRNEFIEPLMCASIFTSIKSVWDYVVLFIQWYNENKIK